MTRSEALKLFADHPGCGGPGWANPVRPVGSGLRLNDYSHSRAEQGGWCGEAGRPTSVPALSRQAKGTSRLQSSGLWPAPLHADLRASAPDPDSPLLPGQRADLPSSAHRAPTGPGPSASRPPCLSAWVPAWMSAHLCRRTGPSRAAVRQLLLLPTAKPPKRAHLPVLPAAVSTVLGLMTSFTGFPIFDPHRPHHTFTRRASRSSLPDVLLRASSAVSGSRTSPSGVAVSCLVCSDNFG